MTCRRFLLACGLAALAVGGMVATAQAEERKGPPSCGAVNFRPLPPGTQEGTQDAGLYKSRHGKVVLRAEVSGGQAKNYYIEVNGKRPTPMKGALPAAVNSCLNSKHVKTPPPSAGESCTGERFRVVFNHVGKAEYIMLFGLQGDTWKLCSASQQ